MTQELQQVAANGFVESFENLQTLLHDNAVAHGWWATPDYKTNLRENIDSLRNSGAISEQFHIDLHGYVNDIPDYNDAEKLALMHSELSEALEGIRGDNKSTKISGFTAEEEELADVIIRAMDYAGKKGLRLADAIIAKAAYNITRPYKHGDKKF